MFARLLFGEQALRGLGQFQEAHSLVEITLVGRPVQGDFLHQFLLLDAPLFGHLHVEGTVNAPVELVDVHGVDSVLNAVAFGLQSRNRAIALSCSFFWSLWLSRSAVLTHCSISSAKLRRPRIEENLSAMTSSRT